MATITRATLDSYARRACMDLDLPTGDIWIQQGESGYAVMQTVGLGARDLDCCLTAKEAFLLLCGLSYGAQIRLKSLVAAEKAEARI